MKDKKKEEGKIRYKKPPYIKHEDTGAIKEYGTSKSKNPVIMSRKTTVIRHMVNMRVLVHTGNKYKEITIKENMIGLKLGSFVRTRKRVEHTSKGAK